MIVGWRRAVMRRSTETHEDILKDAKMIKGKKKISIAILADVYDIAIYTVVFDVRW